MEVQLAKRICSENTFLYLLHCFSEFGETEQNKAHGMVTNYTSIILNLCKQQGNQKNGNYYAQARARIQDTQFQGIDFFFPPLPFVNTCEFLGYQGCF